MSGAKSRLVAWGLVACTLPAAVAIGVGWLQPWVGFGLGVAVVAGTLTLWARTAKLPKWRLVAALFAFFGLVVLAWTTTNALPALKLLAGDVPHVRPDQADPKVGAAVHLLDAQIRTDLAASTVKFVNPVPGEDYFLVGVIAPIVGPGWTTDVPVPAWLLCTERRYETEEATAEERGRRECLGSFEELTPIVREIGGVTKAADPDDAVEAALRLHGLSERDRAPVFALWDAPAAEGREALLELAVVVLLMSFGLWRVSLKAAAAAA